MFVTFDDYIVLYVLILNRFYNVTSLVHSYIVITVFF